MTNLPKYVLITPARNEAQYIELTLQSVVAQTARPVKWVIVSDGSTDATDEIVNRYAAIHPWIELIRMPERRERHFAGKVGAFNAGYERVQGLQYDAIAGMDGDISFGSGYFAFLLEKLAADRSLGLVGTPFQEEGNEGYDYRFVSIEHVSGACQLFRRRCFEDIGGYSPIKGGGIDYVAVLTSRMKGWKTQTFTEMHCMHHRAMGTAQHNIFAARFKNGVKDYVLGGHPLWQIFRTGYQLTQNPVVAGGAALMAGYAWAAVSRKKRAISPELIAFRRREEMARLRKFLKMSGGSGKPAAETRPQTS
jgi:biofilm PGA synthesis N-glycosyltransferase PgaC